MKKYYYAGGARVAMRQGSGSGTTGLSWLLSDHLGSTAITVNSAGTAEVGELRYYAYGGTRYTSGTTPASRRFTGQIEDATIGLYFYNARYYDPALGRFVQADSIVPAPGDPQSLNRYSYCLGNPVKYTDPTGHIVEPPRRINITLDISGWNPQVVQALEVTQEAANTVAELPPILAGPYAAAKSYLKYVKVDSEAGTLTLGNRDPVSASELALEIAGLSAVIGTPTSGLGDLVDDLANNGYIRAVPEDWVGQSRAFKTYPGEDGLSVFEGVSPEDVLAELPGNRVPNTTVAIPRDGLPAGTQVVPTDAPGLSQRLSEAHRILVRPEGWSVDRFAKAIKVLVGWEE
jgi:RHS repeat-associated protein